MLTTLNLTKDIRLPHLELFLKYCIKSSMEGKEIFISTREGKDSLTTLDARREEAL